MQHLEDGTLHSLVDGEIPSAQLGPIQAHLEGCVECRDRLDQARLVAGESDTLIGFMEVPAAGRTGGQAGGRTGGPAGRRTGGQWVRPMALAASLIVAVGLGYVGGNARVPALQPAAPTETVFVARDLPAPPPPEAAEQEAAKDRPGERQNAAPAEAPAAPPPAKEEERRVGQLRAARGEDASALRDSLSRAGSGRRELAASSSRADEANVPPAAAARKSVAADRDRSLLDSVQKKQNLNEAAGKAVARAPQSFALEERPLTGPATSISFFDAVARLGGQIRLLEGMVPVRLEARGVIIRVVYSLDQGELVLEQRREADSLAVALIAPTLGTDSLAKLRARIR